MDDFCYIFVQQYQTSDIWNVLNIGLVMKYVIVNNNNKFDIITSVTVVVCIGEA